MLKSIMDPSKTQIIQDIENARAHLERALGDIIELPLANSAVEMATQILGSYVVLAKGTVGLLSEELREYPVRDVHTWLDGLSRGTDLMENLIEQIRSGTVAQQELKWEEVEIATLMRRLCHINQDIAARHSVKLEFDALVTTSRAWTDRLVAASLFQQILAAALRRASANSAIKVRVEELNDRIITSIQIRRASSVTTERRYNEQKTDLSNAEDHGLEISGKMAERLDGKLWYDSNVEEDFGVFVSLPKPPNPKA